MLTAADIEAEYRDAMSSISAKQAWAMELYAASRALVAADLGSPLPASPQEQQLAREMLFEAEAAYRNARLQRAAAGRA